MHKLLCFMVFLIVVLYGVDRYSVLVMDNENAWDVNNPDAGEHMYVVKQFVERVLIQGDLSQPDELFSPDFLWVYWDDGYQGNLCTLIAAIDESRQKHPLWKVKIESIKAYNLGAVVAWEGGFLSTRLPADQEMTGKDTLGVACFMIRNHKIEKLALHTHPDIFKEIYGIE